MSRQIAPGRELADLLAAPAILELPSICDPLGARAAVDAGYRALALPAYAVGAHLPPGAELSPTAAAETVRRIHAVSGVPLVVDTDAAWDGGDNLAAALRRLAAAGAAGVQLSSRYLPDGAPLEGGDVRRRTHDALMDRVGVAVDAASGMVIAARYDVDTDDGYAVTLERGAALLAAGADALLLQSANQSVLARLAADLPAARLIYASNPARPCQPAVYPPQILQGWGFAAVSNKYHRCYCARATEFARDTRQPHVAGKG